MHVKNESNQGNRKSIYLLLYQPLKIQDRTTRKHRIEYLSSSSGEMRIGCPKRGFVKTEGLVEERLFGKLRSHGEDFTVCSWISKMQLLVISEKVAIQE
jgi:hypothetical protein